MRKTTPVSYKTLETIIESYLNGNISDSMQKIKKLHTEDRARIVSAFRSEVNTKVAFEIAEKIITNDF